MLGQEVSRAKEKQGALQVRRANEQATLSSQCHVTEYVKSTSCASSRSGSQVLKLEVLTLVNSVLAQKLHVTKQQLDDRQMKANANFAISLKKHNPNYHFFKRKCKKKTDKIVQLEDNLTESRMGAKRNQVNLFSANMIFSLTWNN